MRRQLPEPIEFVESHGQAQTMRLGKTVQKRDIPAAGIGAITPGKGRETGEGRHAERAG